MPILSNTQIHELALQKANTAKNPELAIAIIRRAEKILQNRMDGSGSPEDNISWSTRTKVGLIEKMEAKKLAIARFGILGHIDPPRHSMTGAMQNLNKQVQADIGSGHIVIVDGKIFDIGNIANVDLTHRGKHYDPFASRDRGPIILKNGELGHYGDTFDK